MNWWRAWHGLPYDSKLAVVARRCGASRSDVLSVWVACLDFASQNEERGSVSGIDPEEIAVSLDLQPEAVVQIIDGFRSRGMITTVTPCNASGNSNETAAHEMITAWERRQVQRERDDDSTERVRRYREKQKQKNLPEATPTQHHVTPCNAPEQNRTEQRREETHTQLRAFPAPRVTDLDGQVSGRFDEFWTKYPRKQRRDCAGSQWVSVVTTEVEEVVFDCLGRYLASDEVNRGVVMNPDKWLYEQHRNGWSGDWPKPRDSPKPPKPYNPKFFDITEITGGQPF